MQQVINGKKTILVAFTALHLGKPEKLLDMVNDCFPKLGLQKQDCVRTSWIFMKSELEFIWKEMIKAEKTFMHLNPYDGRMGEIAYSETTFPHGNRNLFMIGYFLSWDKKTEAA
ncbi:hypothetical protein ACFE04_030810 [Oxalis oulophora]